MLNTIKISDLLFVLLFSCFAFSANIHATLNEIEEPNIPVLLHQGKFDVLQELIDDGKNIDLKKLPPSLFNRLITLNNWQGVEWLLDNGLTFDDIGFEQNFKILFKQAHCLENLQWLINQGADVDAQNQGEFLISAFLRKGYADAALVLINNGADFDLQNNNELTPSQLMKYSPLFIPLAFPRKSKSKSHKKNCSNNLRLYLLCKHR